VTIPADNHVHTEWSWDAPAGAMAETCRRAVELGLPAVCYLHDVRFDPLRLRAAANAGAELLCCSDFLRREILETAGCEASVLYPAVPAEEYRVEPDPEGAITLITPIAEKGFEIFLALLPRFPEERFLTVEGWPLGAEALSEVERRLAPFPNARLLRRTSEMRDVYRRTRLLLAPSQLKEAAGRVVVEAQVSGIPAVVSERGGLPEMLGAGGRAVAGWDDPDAWEREVKAVLDALPLYRERARANARRPEFSPEHAAARFLAAAERSIAALSTAGATGAQGRPRPCS